MRFKLIVDSEKEEEIVVTSHSANDFVAEIEKMVYSYNNPTELLGYSDDAILRLNLSEIECITVIDRRTYALMNDGNRYRINDTLTAIEERLPSYFIRINKSAIANEREIKYFKTTFSGAVDAVFKSGYREYISRRCFVQIKRRFGI